MLRNRLAFGLAALVFLIALVGFAGLYEIGRQKSQIEAILYKDYEAVQAVNDIRGWKSNLNSTYLPLLSNPSPEERELSRAQFDQGVTAMEEAVGRILNLANEEGEENVSEELALLIETYVTSFSKIFDPDMASEDDTVRFELQREVSAVSQALANPLDAILARNEAQMMAREEAAVRSVRGSKRFLALGVGASLIAAIAILIGQFRQVLGPIRRLTESVDEVRGRNFELLVLPEDGVKEIADLSHSFNGMAAELRLLQRESDENLAISHLRNRAILAGFPSPIFILNEELGLVETNPEAESFLESMALGARLPSKVSELVTSCRDQAEDHLPEDLSEALLFRINDREHFFLPRIFHMEGEDGLGRGWAIVLADVTRFRWLDDMRMDALATVSHEIKTPLTGIRMVLHLLSEGKTGTLNETQGEMVESAMGDCERLLGTLENLLQLSSTASGAGELNLSAISPATLNEVGIATFEHLAKERGISIQQAVPKTLPEIYGDEMRLHEVFSNLISNAIKHSPKNGTIRISAHKRGSDHIRFEVTDEGHGIPEAAQSRIFEKFYRAPDQTVDGIGLGLAITREIVRAHGGNIGFTSPPGGPTTFHFEIPIA